ncbi:MAG TPA: site-2 protease family protein [Isosphaeraceae bacterium]|nr:site-2 protease family protein [Isosphaeraceae bacterium]
MFGVPAQSDFDLRFSVFRIPVRVSPWFWLVSALLCPGSILQQDARTLVIWVLCVFVSILIHELGHGLVAKLFGFWPSIALVGMFGLCDTQAERQTPWQRIAVLFGGPGAGLLTYAVLWGGYIGLGRPQLTRVGELTFVFLLEINLYWSLFNLLLPVIPLDGGRITSEVLSLIFRRNGARYALVISLIVAALVAAFMFIQNQFYMAILFSIFALMSYMQLQSIYQMARYGSYDSGDDWWKR